MFVLGSFLPDVQLHARPCLCRILCDDGQGANKIHQSASRATVQRLVGIQELVRHFQLDLNLAVSHPGDFRPIEIRVEPIALRFRWRVFRCSVGAELRLGIRNAAWLTTTV